MASIFIEGTFCGSETREYTRQADGKNILVNYNLVCEGSDFYKISSDKDYSDVLKFGDACRFAVRPNVYKDKLYWHGTLEV